MFYLNIVGVILTLFLGLKILPKFGIKGKKKIIIIFLIVISISGINLVNTIYERIKEEKDAQEYIELRQETTAVKYEVQKIYLIGRGLTDSQIESLGENPLLKLDYTEGQEHERIGNFKEAIQSYEKILKFRPSSDVNKVSAYNLVGNCYFNLYELKTAMQNYQKALDLVEKLEDEKDKSNGKMVTFYNIGCVYKELAQWKDAQKYLEYSLKESIRLDDDLQKANTLLEVSDVYFQLNKPNIAFKKLFQSIQAFQEALKFHTPEDFPMQYAMTQNNLGATYSILAEVEDKAENCNKAIHAFQETLEFYTLKDFPMQYAATQNNLGIAYRTLAEVEDKAENCKKAIQACQEALKFYTPEDFPMQYAMTQNNLGNAYGTLAEVEDKAENREKAVQAFQEALSFYTKEEFPGAYRILEENIKKCL